MTETLLSYDVGSSPLRPQPPPSFEAQLKALPPAVRSVAESLALRDMESAKRYVAQYLAANRGVRSAANKAILRVKSIYVDLKPDKT